MLQQNNLTVQASQLFRKGQIQRSLETYQKAIKYLQLRKVSLKRDDQNYKNVIVQQAHIQCTIGVIYIIMNKRQQAVKMFQKVIEVSQNFNVDSVVIIRALINLVFLDLMESRYSQALQKFNLTIQIIDGGRNKIQLTKFLFQVLFRVDSLKQLSQLDISEYHSSYEPSIGPIDFQYYLQQRFEKDRFNSIQFLLQAQHKCYQTFLHYKKYDLAVASLRNLLHLSATDRAGTSDRTTTSDRASSQKDLFKRTGANQLRQGRCFINESESQQSRLTSLSQFYKKELGKILASGIINQEKIQFQNTQVLQTLKKIIKQLIAYERTLSNQEASNQQKQDKTRNFWKFAINYYFNSLLKKQFITETQKVQFQKAKKDILNQKNQLIIRQISRSEFVKKSISSSQSHLNYIFSKVQCKMVEVKCIQTRECFQNIKILSNESQKQYISREDTSIQRSQLSRRSFSKQNLRPTGIQVVSPNRARKSLSPLKNISVHYKNTNNMCILTPKESKIQDKLKNKQQLKLQVQKTFQQYEIRKLSKMLRFCQHGSFLNKRNFTSDGGQFKFVRITPNLIKWGKNPEKVDQGGQCYAFKDVKGIIYGKMSPTFKKSQNKLLKPYLCFSLILQKRTLDFYCKDYEQVEAWVCGLTQALHKIGQKIVGYTPGKMRWKKMLMILRYSFVDPLKRHQRNKFSNQSAYSVIQFGKNNYRLPRELK